MVKGDMPAWVYGGCWAARLAAPNKTKVEPAVISIPTRTRHRTLAPQALIDCSTKRVISVRVLHLWRESDFRRIRATGLHDTLLCQDRTIERPAQTMSPHLTRRDFLSDAAIAGVASALRLDASASTNHETSPERRANFDSGWRFLLGDPDGAQASSFQDSTWRSLDLPHDWSIEGAFDENASAKGNGAYLPTGIGWYRKRFVLPSSAQGKRIALQFDGVYQRSEVWINGTSLGMRPYGFISFSYDLTPHLAPTGKPNQIAVRVDNSLQPNCRWYSGSGIYRHTWLRITDPIHIAENGVYSSHAIDHNGERYLRALHSPAQRKQS